MNKMRWDVVSKPLCLNGRGHVMNPLPACASAHLVQRDRMQVVQEGIAADR